MDKRPLVDGPSSAVDNVVDDSHVVNKAYGRAIGKGVAKVLNCENYREKLAN